VNTAAAIQTQRTAARRSSESGDQTNLFQALAAIVGRDKVAIDRGAIISYAWNNGPGAMPGPKVSEVWPIAVVWPRTTEHVAGVLKLCAARGLKFSAHSTGVGALYLSRDANTVVLDLGCMDELQIDPLSQTAVIQPGVTAGRLQAEALKHGLTCHIVGAGPPHSPLASATSVQGIGVTGSSTSSNARNVLSVEWVSPAGDIVRMGTTGDDWFSEEGPGPGFRGMTRGMFGALSGLGVFTRIGYKLHPWGGPKRLQTTGRHPQIGLPCSETMRFYCPVWDSYEDMRDAAFRLNASGVLFALLRMPPNHIGWALTKTSTEYVEMSEQNRLPPVARLENRRCWQVLTVGHTPRQAQYQEAVVRKIVGETRGRFLDVAESDAQILTYNLVTSVYIGRVFRGAGSGGTSFGVCESFGLMPNVFRVGEQLMEKEARPGGAFVEDGKEGFWSWPSESRTLWSECILAAEANTARGTAATMKAFLTHFVMIKRDPGLGMMGFMAGPLNDLFGPAFSRVNDWMRGIKNRFDPHDNAVSSNYITSRKPAIARLWRLGEFVLFSRLGAPLLTLVTKLIGKLGAADGKRRLK
jgi:glycolate oxidase